MLEAGIAQSVATRAAGPASAIERARSLVLDTRQAYGAKRPAGSAVAAAFRRTMSGANTVAKGWA